MKNVENNQFKIELFLWLSLGVLFIMCIYFYNK